MKTPYKSNTVEYNKSSTKRKKPAATPAPATSSSNPTTTAEPVYSTRADIPWDEQQTLPYRFHASGPHTWPALKVIGERGSGKKKEYLLEWEPHPYTQEIFRPTWTLAGSVGDALVKDWKKRKNIPARKARDSNGSALNGAPNVNREQRRGRHNRTIQDSSSEPASQNVIGSLAAPPSTSFPDSNSSNPRTSIRVSFIEKNDATSSSSPVEIAETQQETSQPHRRRLVSVHIPQSAIDKEDYHSLRSSQINSDGGLNFSSQTRSSQSARHPEALPNSTPLTNRQKTSNQANKNSSRGFQPSSSAPINGASRITPARRVTPENLIIEDEQTTSSPSSSKFGTPDYVPSTAQESASGRAASVELGSRPGAYRDGRALTIAELVNPGPQSPVPSSQQPHQTETNRGLTSSNPHKYPTPQDRNIGYKSSEPVPQVSSRATTTSPSHTHTTSSPLNFNTQAAAQPVPLTPKVGSHTHARGPSPRERLGLPLGSPISADRKSFQSTSSGSPRLTLREQLRLIGGSYSSKIQDSISPSYIADMPPNELDMSGTSSVTSPDSRHDSSREFPLEPGHGSQATNYDMSVGGSALPIQDSIEDEQLLDDQDSEGSKGSSSQQSVENERDIAQIDGLVSPTLPLLGPAEYALGLPAEGKIQSVYSDIIKAKRKAILKFINRHEGIGSANGSPNRTHERNDMSEMIQRLHDTTTHIDLGLPGIPTQHSLNPEQHAAYANYAGSKFSLLGHLVDVLKPVECSIVIAAQSGTIQDLLQQYLVTKEVNMKRHDRNSVSQSHAPEKPHEFFIDLVSTMSRYEIDLDRKPLLMIAFDASFDAQDPQIKRIRTKFSSRAPVPVPVVHLLVTNSSEHVNLCIPRSLPSPARLKLLIRATYQARPNLGGKPTYVPTASDEPEGRAMDFSDLQRALRKSPERKLVMLASIVARAAMSQDFDSQWGLGSIPELQLTEVDDTPPKVSGTTTVAETPKEPAPQSRTPISRADTPSGKKRLLEADNAVIALSKRQRLTPTPLREAENTNQQVAPPVQPHDLMNKLQAELNKEKEMRLKAESERDTAQKQLAEWKADHSALLRRYEKRMTKCHELERSSTKLLKTIENNRARQERFAEDNATLKEKAKGLQQELDSARNQIKEGGGDAAATEVAKEEARSLLTKNLVLEKSLENTRKDFEFTRSQYQQASNKAAEFASQVRDLEEKVTILSKQASDEKRRLKEINYEESVKRHISKIVELEQERKTRDVLLRKLEEENRQLKRNRGVQTRGSSVQPPGSPGLDAPGGVRGNRSRQGSPAPGLFPHHASTPASRGSLLRHER